jgi:hypothetical protein
LKPCNYLHTDPYTHCCYVRAPRQLPRKPPPAVRGAFITSHSLASGQGCGAAGVRWRPETPRKYREVAIRRHHSTWRRTSLMYRGDIGHRPVVAAAAASVHPRALRSESDAGRVVLAADALHLRRIEIYAAEEITITSPVVCLFQWCGRFLNALSSPTVCSICTCETRCSPTVES